MGMSAGGVDGGLRQRQREYSYSNGAGGGGIAEQTLIQASREASCAAILADSIFLGFAGHDRDLLEAGLRTWFELRES